ncbi:high affinity K+ transporter 5 [Perilla frutescens var. frutescens]|nr:high affinity K+ transporter 5 [Perilla frutescens var. frutescens]
MFQRFGTDKVGYTSTPILLIWFSFIAAIGIFNFIKYDPSVIKAQNPKYIVDYMDCCGVRDGAHIRIPSPCNDHDMEDQHNPSNLVYADHRINRTSLFELGSLQKEVSLRTRPKISPEIMKEIIHETNSQRLPGLAIFYSELVHGIPPIFKDYVANVPALHSVLVFILFKSLPISRVSEEERFFFRWVQPKEL